jgi:PilY1 beta-propeller domain
MVMRTKAFIIFLFLFVFSFQCLAHDTDLYVLDQSMEQVPPDILFVLDLSGSMRYTPAGQYMYIPDSASCSSSSSCPSNTPFYPTSGVGHTKSCDIDIDTGHEHPTYAIPVYSNSSCTGPFYKTYSSSDPTRNTDCSRLEIAKRGIKKILDANNDGSVTDPVDQNTLNMRIGYMRFYNCGSDSGDNYSSGCNTLRKALDIPYSQIWSSVNGENAYNGTHLASSLKEAKLYLDDHKNGNLARGMNPDPAKACRKKFVIMITDGQDTLACSGSGSDWQSTQYQRRRETVARVKALADAGYPVFVIGFGANMPYFLKNTLNWSAYYGGTDNPSVINSGNLTDYQIPFGLYPSGITGCSTSSRTCYLYSDLIKIPSQKTSCTAGSDGCYCFATSKDPGEASLSGYAFLAEDASQLEQTLDEIRNYIIAILAKSSSYVAPVVPISQMEQTSSENRMYLGMFRPTTRSFWNGNIKKFGIATAANGSIKVGDIIDAHDPPELVIDAQNKIKDSSKSYWSSIEDGGDVEKGAVGEILLARTLPRNIYTYMGTSTNLTDPSNIFNKTNNLITPEVLGLLSGDTDGRNKIVDFTYGLDAYDENKDSVFNTKRDAKLGGSEYKYSYILGAFIHSRPLVIYYKSLNQSVIYAGANDGMLHAFDDITGDELWAFIPPIFLDKLKKFRDELSLQFFVDGSPKAYIEKDVNGNVLKAILMFGLRRGGDRYYFLDVTNPNAPTFFWEINPSTTDFEELGQTWSNPRIGKIKYGAGEKWVAFMGGGYDTNQDDQPGIATTSDPKGTAVYVVDFLHKTLLWKYSKTKDPEMKYSIPSDIARVDTNGDGFIDRLYVGDMGGRVWRLDIGDPSPASWLGKRVFQASGKIFYPPDVTLEKDEGYYEMLLFGTGDRESPKDRTFVNKLYTVKDKNLSQPVIESDLEDVTQDLLQDPNASESDKTAQLNRLKAKKGWFITQEGSGEKCLSEAVVFSGAVYYATFTPSVGNEGDICSIGEGTASIYILKYKTGNAVFNLDDANDIGGTAVISKSDRSMLLGKGVPSGIILGVLGDRVMAYGGVGGGVFSPPLPSNKNLVPINWRNVF